MSVYIWGAVVNYAKEWDRPGFRHKLRHLLDVQSWKNYLSSLSLSFLIHKMEETVFHKMFLIDHIPYQVVLRGKPHQFYLQSSRASVFRDCHRVVHSRLILGWLTRSRLGDRIKTSFVALSVQCGLFEAKWFSALKLSAFATVEKRQT